MSHEENTDHFEGNGIIPSGQENSNVPQPEVKKDRSLINLIVGMMIGVLFTFFIAEFVLPATASNWTNILYGAIGTFGVLVLVVALIYFIARKLILRKLKEAIDKGRNLLDGVVEVLMADNFASAQDQLKRKLPEFTAQVKIFLLKRWALRAFGIIAVFFTGLFSSMLVFQQNELVESQNKLINQQVGLEDQQVLFQEAELRKADAEVSAIIEQSVQYFLEHPDSHAIPAPLKSRIATSTHQFAPYESPGKEGNYQKSSVDFLSPERGRLFAWLIEFKPSNLTDILAISDFSYADLEGRTIVMDTLVENLKLEHANLKNCTLRNIDWRRAWMKDSDLTGATLDNVTLFHSDLNNVRMDSITILGKLDISSSNYHKMTMLNVKYPARNNGQPQIYAGGILAAEVLIGIGDSASFSKEEVDSSITEYLLRFDK